MAINYTTLLGLAQPVTGTEANTWGDVVNDSITALLDSAIAGTATISLTAGNVTLTDVDGSADQARMAILVLTGTPGTSRNVVAPSRSKSYIVINQSDSSAVIKGSATTGVAVRAGQAATCSWNGADFEIVASGDVDGPASATDNAIVRYDGTTGKLIQNSAVTIDDSNNVSGVVQLNATTVDTTNLEVTNLKAKDGTAAGSIADSTGVVTLASSVLTTTDINGGTINGAIIGGSTAAAGTFTNLAYTGTLTGGTGIINIGSGQVYKDASGNLGIGTASPSGNLNVYSSSAAQIVLDSDTSSTIAAKLFANSAGSSIFQFSKYRGTLASPTAVASGDRMGIVLFQGYGGTNVRNLASIDSYIDTFVSDSNISSYISFSTSSSGGTTRTEKMRLSASGNLGLGIVPPAWTSNARAINVGAWADVSTTANGFGQFGWNNYESATGVFNYRITAAASAYRQVSGAHLWFTAPSGTAGDAISFTEAMTLTAAGNLGLGTSSPAKRLHVKGTNDNVAIFDNDGSRYTTCYFANNGTAKAVIDWDNTASYFEIAAFGANPIVFGTNSTERMRIDSSGNVGISTTPSAWNAPLKAMQVIGASIWNNNNTTVFSSNIIRGGSYAPFYYSNTSGGEISFNLNGQAEWTISTAPVGTGGAAATLTERMRIASDGTVTMNAYGAGAATFSAAGVISSVSDETWKTKDGVPTNPDEMLQKLEPGYWFYNEEKAPIFGAERQLGFYAQNVNAAIGNEAAPTPEEGKPWGYYDRSVLAVTVMSLKNALKAIQEQQAIITQLQADVAALKGN